MRDHVQTPTLTLGLAALVFVISGCSDSTSTDAADGTASSDSSAEIADLAEELDQEVQDANAEAEEAASSAPTDIDPNGPYAITEAFLQAAVAADCSWIDYLEQPWPQLTPDKIAECDQDPELFTLDWFSDYYINRCSFYAYDIHEEEYEEPQAGETTTFLNVTFTGEPGTDGTCTEETNEGEIQLALQADGTWRVDGVISTR